MIGRSVAPAGAPIRGRDLVMWSRRWIRLRESEEEVRSSLCAHLGRRYCVFTSTGRAGLSLLLSVLKSLRPDARDEVVIPSYTCYSVPASTVRAGLRPRIVDVDGSSLDFDLEKLGNADFRRVLAVVVTNLYGLPGQLPRIAEITRDNGVFLVDDAAQSLGATVGGRPSGAWGDAGLLSFDKGKPLSAIDAGAVVADSDAIGEALEARIGGLDSPSILTTSGHLFKLLAYATFLRPSLYWIPNALPGLGLGETAYRTDFPLQRSSRCLTGLARVMWPRLGEFTARRIANAERYRAAIARVPILRAIAPVEEARPSYLRFPVLADHTALRDDLLRRLVRAGIGATASYPGSIADIPALRHAFAGQPDAEVGRSVAKRILTLPTHPYVTKKDVDRALAVVSACTTSHSSAGVVR